MEGLSHTEAVKPPPYENDGTEFLLVVLGVIALTAFVLWILSASQAPVWDDNPAPVSPQFYATTTVVTP
jgi:hypothetical protein